MTWLRAQWDRAGAAGLCGLGVILLVIGWFGVSNTTYAAEQVPWVISCGIGGLFSLGVAAVLWLSADLQDEWRKLDSLEAALRETATVPAPAPPVLPEQVPVSVPTSAPAVRRTRPRTAVKAG